MSCSRITKLTTFSLLIASLCAEQGRCDPPRYLAVFDDGQRVEGQNISGWQTVPGVPRLDTTPLQTDQRSLRWLRNRQLEFQNAADPNSGLVMFTSGDQLPGRVVAFEPAQTGTPAHVVVQTNSDINHPELTPSRSVRVALDYIRSIRWGSHTGTITVPQRIVLRNGRRIHYERLQWKPSALRILTDDGVEQFSFDQISELSLSAHDVWQSYFKQLATLCSGQLTPIIRVESVTRLVATTSQTRLAAIAVAPAEERRMAEVQLARLQPRRRTLIARHKSEQTRFEQRLTSVTRRHDQQMRKLDNDLRNMRRRMRNATEAEIKRKTEQFSQRTKTRLAQQRKASIARYEAQRTRNQKQHADRLRQLDNQIQQIQQELRNQSAAGNLPQRWKHMFHPAWSLDPLWINFDSIRTRWTFPAHEVPLSCIVPAEIKQHSAFGYSWLWRVNQNVRGGTLSSGGQEYGWGLGVHATSELHFPLPDFATEFRTRVGLDDIVGQGGSVQARVDVHTGSGIHTLFQSQPIIGPHTVQDTGWLALGPTTSAASSLILSIDALAENPPKHADPLDIRDHADWLQPILRLDPQRLHAELQKRANRAAAAKPTIAPGDVRQPTGP